MAKPSSGWNVKVTVHFTFVGEFKNVWNSAFSLVYIFTAWCFLKHSDNWAVGLIFTLVFIAG
jgi:hypothetical protein